MIIDFHTHIFPDKIAAAAVSKLEAAGQIRAFAKGTLTHLRELMGSAGITHSVVLPVVTDPQQFSSINRFACAISEMDGFTSFGGIHPHSVDIAGEIREIVAMGLKGIKLHPDYQRTCIDDVRYIRIVDEAASHGLIVVIHAGLDVGLPDPIHCTPEKARQMLDHVRGGQVVLAHMGGFRCWDQVEQYLVGTDVYMDTSYSLGKMDEKQFLRIVSHHGADKILFGTDSPWGGQAEEVSFIKRILSPELGLNQILHKNAASLLKI